MTFLPLIDRQLRVRSRQRAFYWSRLSVVLLGIFFVVPQLLVDAPRNSASHTGAYAFNSVTALLFTLCCCAGVLTANAIIEERTEGTLGLLYLTKVNAFDVAAGALGSAGLTCLILLLAFVPLVTIPILAGGVSGGEALRKVVVLIATLLLSLALGLRTQAGRSRWLRSIWSPVLLMAVLTIVIYPIGPAAAFIGAAEANYRTHPARYWEALGVTLALAPLVFFSASTCLRKSTNDSVSTVETATRRKKPKAVALIPDVANPIQTVIERDRTIKNALWLGAALEVVFGGGVFWLTPRLLSVAVRSQYSMTLFYYGGAIVQAAIFAWVAARTVHSMQQSGEMELLLTTPVGASNIVAGIWTALKKAARGPVILMIVPSAIWLLLYVATPLSAWPWPSNSFLVVQSFNCAISIVHTIVATAATLWLGLWFGISARKTSAAVLYTVILAKGVPSLLSQIFSLCLNTISSPFVVSGTGVPPVSFWLIRLIPSVVSLMLLWLMMRSARRRTIERLTHSAPSRFASGFPRPLAKALYNP